MHTDATFWNKIARKYATQPIADMSSYEHTLNRTRSYLPPEAQVLELGCGTGSTALLLAPGIGHITACDVSPEMSAIGREKARAQNISNITFTTAPSDDPRFAQTQLDAVLGFNLMHLLPKPEQTIAAAHAALKPGGYFITKTPCLSNGPFYLRPMVHLMRGWMMIRHLGHAPYVNFFSIPWLESQIQSAGFEIIETGNFPAKPPNRYIVARKS